MRFEISQVPAYFFLVHSLSFLCRGRARGRYHQSAAVKAGFASCAYSSNVRSSEITCFAALSCVVSAAPCEFTRVPLHVRCSCTVDNELG